MTRRRRRVRVRGMPFRAGLAPAAEGRRLLVKFRYDVSIVTVLDCVFASVL